MKEENVGLMSQLFAEVGIISQLSSALLEHDLPYGIKASQFKILIHFVRTGDGSTPAKLAKAFQVTKGAMTNNVNRLLALELVTVEEDKNDRRVKRIFITDKGRETQEQGIKKTIQSLSHIEKEFNIDEFKAALPFLTKLRSYLDENRS